jgi:uncharacterized membrane protein (DUF485 family)
MFIKAILEAIENRRDFNRFKRQLRENATSRAIIMLVCSGALDVGQGRRLIRPGRAL